MENENENQVGELYVVGTRGYSAYEIAVQEGFEGTEEEWLESLVGPQGPQGPQGEIGPQGIPGTPPQLRIGRVDTLNPQQNAYVNITGTPSNVILSFGIPKGEKGDEGEPGPSPDLSNYYTKGEVDNLIPEVPTNISYFTNDSDYTTKSYVDGLIGDINDYLDLINGEVI